MKASKQSTKLIALRILTLVLIIAAVSVMCGYKNVRKDQPQRPKFVTIENAVRFILEKPSGELTADDYLKIKEIKAPIEDIASLEGIQYCVNLRKLDLSRNKISDISQLEGLSKLYELDLRGNSIIDISTLEHLRNLRVLNLDRNKIEKIDSLANLRLDTLILANNKIIDIKPLSQIKSLNFLDLGGNKISDLSPLLKLNKLRYVNLIQTDMNSREALDTIATLDKYGVYVEKTWMERSCVRQLEMIGSAQYAYAHNNPNNPNRDYCSWETLKKHRKWLRDDPLSNWIQDYDIPVFRVVQSSRRADNRRIPSSFTIVAIPEAREYSLRTYVISSSQMVRVWVGDDSEWTLYPLQLKNPDLWRPLR